MADCEFERILTFLETKETQLSEIEIKKDAQEYTYSDRVKISPDITIGELFDFAFKSKEYSVLGIEFEVTSDGMMTEVILDSGESIIWAHDHAISTG